MYQHATILFNTQDRYADAQSRPPVDAQQDWFLISGEEGDGYTILMFSRNWTTCDDRDREIVVTNTLYQISFMIDCFDNYYCDPC